MVRRTKFDDNRWNDSPLRGEKSQIAPRWILIPAFLPVTSEMDFRPPKHGVRHQILYLDEYWRSDGYYKHLAATFDAMLKISHSSGQTLVAFWYVVKHS